MFAGFRRQSQLSNIVQDHGKQTPRDRYFGLLKRHIFRMKGDLGVDPAGYRAASPIARPRTRRKEYLNLRLVNPSPRGGRNRYVGATLPAEVGAITPIPRESRDAAGGIGDRTVRRVALHIPGGVCMPVFEQSPR